MLFSMQVKYTNLLLPLPAGKWFYSTKGRKVHSTSSTQAIGCLKKEEGDLKVPSL
jgi:hypothetical protein